MKIDQEGEPSLGRKPKIEHAGVGDDQVDVVPNRQQKRLLDGSELAACSVQRCARIPALRRLRALQQEPVEFGELDVGPVVAIRPW